MRIAGLALAVVYWLRATAALAGPSSGQDALPLFPSSSPSTLPTRHTSLASLLPVLPILAPAPEHTLLVTLATPAFKPMLYNWLCFLRYKAQWGAPPAHDLAGDPYTPSERALLYADTPKVLVITSDEGLARELSDHGVVTWWVRGTDWEAVELADELDEDDPEKDTMLAYAERMLEDDLFSNLRLLDLLLPPTDEPPVAALDGSTTIPWGTLRYQSLMLERTAVISALVGALAKSQRNDPEWRKEQDAKWQEKVLAHDWETGALPVPEFEGVKGVLLVDNDAVWLSSPTAFLSHYYRPTGPYPSVVFAQDMDPTTQNAWGTHTMPCACFIYSRVSDAGAQRAAPMHAPDSSPLDAYTYSPSAGAAEVWRATTLCHISMLQEAHEAGRRMQQWRRASDDGPGQGLGGASSERPFEPRAPSFQATALGPAVFLSEQPAAFLPEISHERFLSSLGSGEVEDLFDLLEDAELDLNPETGRADRGRSCLALAQAQQLQCANPSAESDLGAFATSLTREYLEHVLRAPPPHRPVRVEALPLDLFPPGMRFFDGGMEPGTRACVVHANYATGSAKEQLLRKRGLWALVQPENGDGEWRCDARIMEKA